jgi:pimeloyl-ACP methyl ester carboxylesterase
MCSPQNCRLVSRQLSAHRCSWTAWLAAVLLVSWTALPSASTAQEAKAEKPAAKTAKTAEEEIPKPQDEMLTTADGLKLAITYYPGTQGKESVPVILIHGFSPGSRKDYADLAPLLQEKLGCAVILPDLRGHGDSKTQGKNTLNALSMPPRNFGLMVSQDMMAVKDFLWKKNNAGELNIDKTCVVGAEMGALVALDYALFDSIGYEQNTAQYGRLKLGCFVKALVLISPDAAFKSFKAAPARDNPQVRGKISVLILVGNKGSKAMTDAKQVYKIFERFHPVPEKKEAQTLFFRPLDTSLQGVKMLPDTTELYVSKLIGQFIHVRVVKNPDAKTWVWAERKRPHE